MSDQATEDQAPPPSAEALFQSLAVSIAAAAAAQQYLAATLVVAAAERGAIDPARFFALLDVIVSGFAGGAGADIPASGMTARMLADVRTIFDSLTRLPPGAGHA